MTGEEPSPWDWDATITSMKVSTTLSASLFLEMTYLDLKGMNLSLKGQELLALNMHLQLLSSRQIAIHVTLHAM